MKIKATVSVYYQDNETFRWLDYPTETVTAAAELVRVWRLDPRTTLVIVEVGQHRRVWDCIGGHTALTRFAGTDHEEETIR